MPTIKGSGFQSGVGWEINMIAAIGLQMICENESSIEPIHSRRKTKVYQNETLGRKHSIPYLYSFHAGQQQKRGIFKQMRYSGEGIFYLAR